MLSKMVFIFVLILPALVYSMGSKIDKIPMKAAERLVIPDGEYLRYGFYAGGERVSVNYFVTRLKNDKEKGKQALLYYQTQDLKSGKKIPGNYQKFSTWYLISLDQATLLESQSDIGLDTNKNERMENVPNGYNGLFYWHYVLNAAKKTVEYENRVWDGSEVKTRKSRMAIDPAFPYWDWMSGMFFAVRFMDIQGKGVVYFVIPEAIKEPLALTFKFIKKETITTGAGTFECSKIGMAAADPFLQKLVGPFSKDMVYWVENSDRKLLVQLELPAGYFKLENVSNVMGVK